MRTTITVKSTKEFLAIAGQPMVKSTKKNDFYELTFWVKERYVSYFQDSILSIDEILKNK